LFLRKQRVTCPPSEFAMPDLPPPWRAQSTGFACGIGREVVMEHEVFAILAFERVDDLLVLARPQGCYSQRLCFAAGEQRGAVRARQNADLAGYRPNAAGVAAVDPTPVAQNSAPDDVFLDVLEEFQRDRMLSFLREELAQFGLRCIELVTSVLLAPRGVGGFDQRTDLRAQPRSDFL